MGEVGEGLQRLGHQREVPVGPLVRVLWGREVRVSLRIKKETIPGCLVSLEILLLSYLFTYYSGEGKGGR